MIGDRGAAEVVGTPLRGFGQGWVTRGLRSGDGTPPTATVVDSPDGLGLSADLRNIFGGAG